MIDSEYKYQVHININININIYVCVYIHTYIYIYEYRDPTHFVFRIDVHSFSEKRFHDLGVAELRRQEEGSLVVLLGREMV